MDNFELLSRASGFLVRKSDRSGVHIVTSAHVVHPFAFPGYYPLEEHAWLRFVNEDHVQTKFEIREREGGRVVFCRNLGDKVYRHETRDVCVVHPEDPTEFLQAIAEFDKGTQEHILELEDDEVCVCMYLWPCIGPCLCCASDQVDVCGCECVGNQAVKSAVAGKDDVMFVGHEIIEASGELQEQLPCVVPGTLLGQTPQGQMFASTQSTLKMGMCGGPVINGRGKCIGAVEGIVPETGPEPLRLCAAVIAADTVATLLREVEALRESEQGSEAFGGRGLPT